MRQGTSKFTRIFQAPQRSQKKIDPSDRGLNYWEGFSNHFLELVSNFTEANGNFTTIWYSNKSRGGSDLGCGVAQTVARRLAVRQARVRISARHLRGGPVPSGSNEEIKSGARRVIYIKCMYVCSINVK